MDSIVIQKQRPRRWMGIASAALVALIALILAVPEARVLVMFLPLILLSGLAIPVTPISGSPQMTIGEEGIDAGECGIIRWKDIDRASLRPDWIGGGLLNLVLRDGRKDFEMCAETTLLLLLVREGVPVRVTGLRSRHPAYRVLVILLNLLSFGLFIGALAPAVRLLAGDGDPTGPGVMTGMIFGSFVGWSLAALLALCNRFGGLDRWNKGSEGKDENVEISACEVLRSESALQLGGVWVFTPIERRTNEIQKVRRRAEFWFLTLGIVIFASGVFAGLVREGSVSAASLLMSAVLGLFSYAPIRWVNRREGQASPREAQLIVTGDSAVVKFAGGESRQIPMLELCKLASSSESTEGFWLRRLFLTEWKPTPALPSSSVVRFGPNSSREPSLECD